VKEMLDDLAKKHPDQFKLWYTLDFPPENWKYGTGFITDTMIKEHLCPPSDSSVVLMCGPPPMVKFACKANLDKLNYPAHSQIDF
jgi:cytochrome-b5 reductase